MLGRESILLSLESNRMNKQAQAAALETTELSRQTTSLANESQQVAYEMQKISYVNIEVGLM